MAKQILNIGTHLAKYGEFVDFFTRTEGTWSMGYETPGGFNKQIKTAAVFPHGWQKLDLDVNGANLQGAKIVFCKTYFPMSNDSENPFDTRMSYESRVYRLVSRQKYTKDYYVYLAEWLRVDPTVTPTRMAKMER